MLSTSRAHYRNGFWHGLVVATAIMLVLGAGVRFYADRQCTKNHNIYTYSEKDGR